VQTPKGYSTPVIQNFKFESPWAGLSEDERRAAIRDIGEKATQRLSSAQVEFQGRVTKYDPCQLLATAATYCLHKPVGDDPDFTEDGPYPQAVIEALQSLLLAIPFDRFADHPTFQPDLFKFLDFARSCIDDLNNKGFASIAEADKENTALLLAIENARSYTRGIRNWGYPQHMREIIAELFEPLEHDIKALLGFAACDLITFFDSITDVSSSRILKLFEATRGALAKKSPNEMIAAFGQLFAEQPDGRAEFDQWLSDQKPTVEQVRLMLTAFLHQFFSDFFTFSIEQLKSLFPGGLSLEQLHSLMKRLSVPFGEFRTLPFEHLLTQSPIRLRPFIALDDGRYFIPVLGLLNSFAIEIVESLIKPDDSLWTRYPARRAKYLESKVHEEFREAFPEAIVESNLSWRDPVSGEEFETDTLVLLGPLALVVEAKSKRVSDSARRGGPERLKREFKELVDEASEQAHRLASLLEREMSDIQFTRKDGRSFTVSAAAIQRAVCLAVMLDCLPTLSLCWTALVKAGLVDGTRRPAIALTLSDLIVALSVLAEPAIRLHYIWRRSECEAAAEYFGDEEDLLVYYLSNGLAHLIATPKDQAASFYLSGNSDQLRRFFMAVWIDPDTEVPPPRRLLTPWWQAVIRRIQQLDHPDKWEVACCVLDLTYEEQKNIEQRFRGLPKRFRKSKKKPGKDAIICRPMATESQCALVFFGYRDLPDDERRNRAQNLMTQVHHDLGVERVVLFAKNVEILDPPYDFLYFSRIPSAGPAQLPATVV
jgi:hypothetical protein